MKQIFALFLMLSLTAFAGDKTTQDHKAHKHDHNVQTNQASCELKEGEAHASINLPTIQCGMCVKTITKALNEVEGVGEAKVDLEGKTAHVHFADNKLKASDLETAVTAAGYDANEKKRDEKAHAKLPMCCQSER